MNVTFIQSSDNRKYVTMLNATARTILEYCRQHGWSYEAYTGVKRGYWDWQASYNRIFQLQELVDRDFDGWVVHMDADAYIVDLNFDLAAYLADKAKYAAILTPSMATDHYWDINDGICLFNLGNAAGRHLVRRWRERMDEKLSDVRLREAELWLDDDSDQDLIQQILMHEPEVAQTVFLQSTDLINSSYASFIRQHLRGYSDTFEERLAAIVRETDAVIAGRGASSDLMVLPETADAALERARSEVVGGLYRALMARDPDEGGRAAAINHLSAHGMEEGIRSLLVSMMDSEEYRARGSR